MTNDPQEETDQGLQIQEAPQEGAPRQRRTLSGRLVSAVRSDFDPWNSMKLMGDMMARRARRERAKQEESDEKVRVAGLSPDAGLPQTACLKSKCGLPWSEHLTATGRLKAGFAKSGGHRPSTDVPPARMDRRTRRALIREQSRRLRVPVQAAFYTHTIFRDPSGKDHRVSNDQLDAFVLKHSRQNAR